MQLLGLGLIECVEVGPNSARWMSRNINTGGAGHCHQRAKWEGHVHALEIVLSRPANLEGLAVAFAAALRGLDGAATREELPGGRRLARG
jgi:hypothetical protein